MNRKQKLILGLLALANVVVIGLIANYVVQTTISDRQGSAASFTGSTARGLPAEALPTCTRYLLETLTLPGQSVEVGEDDKGLWINLDVAPSDSEESATPQLLWLSLDLLTPTFSEACPDATTVTLAVSVPGGGRRHHYVAEMNGVALNAWLRDEMSEDDFTAGIRYRAVR